MDSRKYRLSCLLWTALLGVALTTPVGASSEPEDTVPIEALDCVINPSVVADLGSGVPGILHSVVVDRSDLVKAGDPVAELESSVEATALALAQARAEMDAEVKLRRVNAGFGRRQRERTEDLYQRKAISSNDMDERNTEARLAGIQLRQALDNQKLAELERQRAVHVLQRRTIKSPINGVVMERFKTVGEYVEDQPVVRVAQLDPLHVEVFVPVKHLGEIRPGMQAEVWTDSVADKRWQARVSRVDRVADVASGTYGVRLELPNTDYAVPAGLRCQLAFRMAPNVAGNDSVENSKGPRENSTGPKAEKAATSSLASVPDDTAVQRPQSAQPVVVSPPAPVVAEKPVPAAAVAGTPAQPQVDPQPVGEAIAAQPAPQTQNQTESPSEIAGATEPDPSMATDGFPLCHLIGPFETERQAKDEARLMRKNGFTVMLERQEAKVEVGHKVASRPLESRAAARKMVRALRNAGFTDLYLPRRHETPARVYLGLYHKERDAQQHIAKLAKKGFEAELLPWQDSVNEFFLLARKVTEDGSKAAQISAARSPDSSQACAQFASR